LSSLNLPDWLTHRSSCEHFNHNGEGIPLLCINTPLCQAVISLQGAQVLSFIPHQKDDLLWLSSANTYQYGERIWGGIPICAPWFGRHTNPTLPIHGFVQEHIWALVDAQINKQHEAVITLQYNSNEHKHTHKHPQAFTLSLTIIMGNALTMTLSCTNNSDTPIDFSWAFHNYLAVQQPEKATIHGLANNIYLDATQAMLPMTQLEPFVTADSIDRVFLSAPSHITLACDQSVSIRSINCPSKIIWHPDDALTFEMPELGPIGQQHFICIEPGAAFADTWTIAPHQNKQGTQILSCD
jgi:glucose-6-phosphate 1-epimerase